MRLDARPQTLARLSDGVFALLLCAIAMSFVVAALVAIRRGLALDAFGWAGVGAAAAILVAVLRLALEPPAVRSDLRFLMGVAVAATAARALIWLAAASYRQAGDCLFMLDAIRLLARDGFGDEVMLRLAARYYDDYLWAGRSLPFLLPLARLWPGYEVETARALNLLLSLAHNLLVYGLSRRLAGRRVARAAYALVFAIPIHSWLILDYTHQYFGAFLVVSGVYLLVRASDSARVPVVRRVADGVLYGSVLAALHVQSGIDKFMLVAAAMAFVLFALGYGLRDPRTARLAVMLAAAALVYAPIAHRFTEWLNQYRPARMSSHPISFTARGWNTVTMGEYYGVYEQIDRETPWPHKPDAMKGLILSQMAYEPAKTLLALPPVKVAKYFLIGYATAIEQQLADAKALRLESLFRGMRIAFAPVFLLLVGWGLWRMLGSAYARTPDLVFATGVPLLFCAVYLAAGETSPRYSFHVHGLLAVLGAMAFASAKNGLAWYVRARRVGGWAAAVALVLLLAAAAAPKIIRTAAAPLLLADLRSATYDDGRPIPADSTVFTRVAGDRMQQILLNPPHNRPMASFFVWPLKSAGESANARFVVEWRDQTILDEPIRSMRHIRRFEFDTGGEEGLLRVRVAGDAEKETETLVRWGYIRYDPNQ